jgi:REP element-mobilizing transposase RayT
MWNDISTPLAYLISFRSYGTWLHGDIRGSIDRYHNRYGSPYLAPNEPWNRYHQRRLRTAPFYVDPRHRHLITSAISETCAIRRWALLALNVRTNHVHAVVSANRASHLVLNAFKANSTRVLREAGMWLHVLSPWARKGSRRNLWSERSVAQAIDYVLYGQGDDLPERDD